MDWSEATYLNTAILYFGVLVPFWFLMILAQGRLTYELPWRTVIPFAGWFSVVAAAICWVLLAWLPLITGWW